MDKDVAIGSVAKLDVEDEGEGIAEDLQNEEMNGISENGIENAIENNDVEENEED